MRKLPRRHCDSWMRPCSPAKQGFAISASTVSRELTRHRPGNGAGMRVAAILVAAGSGSRFGAETPKQFLPLAGKPVIRHAAEALAAARRPAAAGGRRGGDRGGAGRSAASAAGRRAAPRARTASAPGWRRWTPHAPDVVLVHDAARPLIPPGTIPALLAALEHAAGRDPGRAGRRYAEAGGRRPDHRHRAARGPVPCPDAAGLPLRRCCSPRIAAASARRRPTMPSLLEAVGERGGDRPRLRGQHQADLCRGPAPAGACHDRPPDPPCRHRLRRPCAGGRPAADAVRRRGAARQGPGRPLRRRCRHPRAVRRDLRRAGRGRHRPPLPALARPPGRTPTAPASWPTPPNGSPPAAAGWPMPT